MSSYQSMGSGVATAPTWAGYEYPDGSYSIGLVPPEKKAIREKKYDYECRKVYEVVEWSEPDATEYLGYADHKKRRLRDDKVQDYESSLSKLDPPSELSQTKKRYGQNGISRNGKRKVRAGCALLERKYGIERLGLCTITLPSEKQGLDKSDLYFISQQWATFLKRVLQEVKRVLKRREAPTELIAVTEIQENRYRRLGELAPHIHFCYVAKARKCGSHYYLKPDDIRRIVGRVLWTMLDRDSDIEKGIDTPPINCNSCCNLQIIKKSASNYLSKYMSKGGEILEELKDAGLEDAIPNQWWSPVGGMRKWIKKNIRKISSNVAEFLLESEGIDGIKVFKRIEAEMSDGEEKIVGVYIKCEQWLYEILSGIKWDKPIGINEDIPSKNVIINTSSAPSYTVGIYSPTIPYFCF